MSASNPRRANGHRRDQVRRRVLAEEDHCWLCGGPVDKSLKTPDPWSPEVDEVIPVSLGGDPFARDNCRLSHRRHLQREARQRNARSEADDATALDRPNVVNPGRVPRAIGAATSWHRASTHTELGRAP